MTKTMNYNLNQWEPTDEIKVEDFNADNAAVDAALGLLSAERIIVGSYVGNGKKNRTIELPFTPVFVIQIGTVNSANAMTVATADAEFFVTAGSGGGSGDNTRVVENGFQVGRTFATWHNTVDVTEYYIAIR